MTAPHKGASKASRRLINDTYLVGFQFTPMAKEEGIDTGAIIGLFGSPASAPDQTPAHAAPSLAPPG